MRGTVPAAVMSRVAATAVTVEQTVIRAWLGDVVSPTLFPDAATWRAPGGAARRDRVGVTLDSRHLAGGCPGPARARRRLPEPSAYGSPLSPESLPIPGA
jgi:hypothetical protein